MSGRESGKIGGKREGHVSSSHEISFRVLVFSHDRAVVPRSEQKNHKKPT